MEETSQKLKSMVISRLTRNPQIADEPYLLVRSNPPRHYSRRQIASEIEQETEFGVEFLAGIVMLAIDLVAREKETIHTPQ